MGYDWREHDPRSHESSWYEGGDIQPPDMVERGERLTEMDMPGLGVDRTEHSKLLHRRRARLDRLKQDRERNL